MKFLNLLLIVVFSIPVYGQSRIGFAYDAAGNRIKREIVVNKSNAPEKGSQNAETFYDTLGEKTVRLTHKQSGLIIIDIMNYEPNDEGLIDVYTVDGLRVYYHQIDGEEITVDLSGKDSGLYILRVILNGNSSSWSIKI
ncbi:MAG: T9SS type A sorting domain-containing protein [Muribaculaceae bacterium]|nr:T9SS type A sorting domain-containing protein [Muribaculaceae bacterium]